MCLPESHVLDEDREGFVAHIGIKYFQQACRTNGGGPEMYKQCAPGKLKERSTWFLSKCINHRYE